VEEDHDREEGDTDMRKTELYDRVLTETRRHGGKGVCGRDVAKAIGCLEGQAKRMLEQLQADGLVRRDGNGRGTRWVAVTPAEVTAAAAEVTAAAAEALYASGTPVAPKTPIEEQRTILETAKATGKAGGHGDEAEGSLPPKTPLEEQRATLREAGVDAKPQPLTKVLRGELLQAALDAAKADLSKALDSNRLLAARVRELEVAVVLPVDGRAPDAEVVAKLFHEQYERLAPEFAYSTRKESAVPWEDVPEKNRRLMIATVAAVFTRLGLLAGSPEAHDVDFAPVGDAGVLPEGDLSGLEEVSVFDSPASLVDIAVEIGAIASVNPSNDIEKLIEPIAKRLSHDDVLPHLRDLPVADLLGLIVYHHVSEARPDLP
jgi:DNA-binding MarR family transcriptional regulator